MVVVSDGGLTLTWRRDHISMFIAPYSPPYTTKRLYMHSTAFVDVIWCVWVLMVACDELKVTTNDHM